MASVFPFRPFRYSEKAGRLEDLATQPYDKITPETQTRYLSLSPHNLVRIILGPHFDTDTGADNVYTRAAWHLEQWIAGGILVQEAEPCLFAYSQEFSMPDTGERLLRKGFIGLGAVEEYSSGVVHRHERTLSGPKKDRMELLRRTRAHFGQIFMLYPDPQGEIDRTLDEVSEQPPCAVVHDEYEAVHRLWKISDSRRIDLITGRMSDQKLLIADGHHRYETALAFRNESPHLEDARRVMMTFVSMRSPGLRILATHRLVDRADPERFLARARAVFPLRPAGSLEALRAAWTEPHAGSIRIGIACGSGLDILETERRDGELDVAFLHDKVLRGLLAIGEEDVRNESNLRYIRGAEAAVQAVSEGAASIAFLLEPASIEDVARTAFSGGVMPQKSTDFYPKLLSGLTIYRLER